MRRLLRRHVVPALSRYVGPLLAFMVAASVGLVLAGAYVMANP